MHDDNVTDEGTGKPNQIMDYNATKGGVDTVDLMCARCSTSRNTRRWPMVVFFRLLDLAAINSYKIFKANNPDSTIVRRIYTFNLALSLMSENIIEPQLQAFLKKSRYFLKNTNRLQNLFLHHKVELAFCVVNEKITERRQPAVNVVITFVKIIQPKLFDVTRVCNPKVTTKNILRTYN